MLAYMQKLKSTALPLLYIVGKRRLPPASKVRRDQDIWHEEAKARSPDAALPKTLPSANFSLNEVIEREYYLVDQRRQARWSTDSSPG